MFFFCFFVVAKFQFAAAIRFVILSTTTTRCVSVRQHTQFVSVSFFLARCVFNLCDCDCDCLCLVAFCACALHVLDWLRSPSCSAFCCLRLGSALALSLGCSLRSLLRAHSLFVCDAHVHSLAAQLHCKQFRKK